MQVDDRLRCEALELARCEPLGGELVKRRLRLRLFDCGLGRRRPPDPAADVGKHVRELGLGLCPRRDLGAERHIVAAPVGAEAERINAPALAAPFEHLSCSWAGHQFEMTFN